MRDVGDKIETLRSATAVSVVTMAAETARRLQANDVPKKDILPIAKAAAVMAAKKTQELIPYCHPLPIDVVDVTLDVGTDRVTIHCTVTAIWKTGVEMEALTASSIAALTIYDMLKPIDKNMEIVSTKLLAKTGGKTDWVEKLPANFKAAVIVTSDGTAVGKRVDNSGKIIKERLESLGVREVAYLILPDEKEQIRQALLDYCVQGVQLILTTGGTGLGPRDVTVEATKGVIEREMPAVVQAFQAYGLKRTPYAMLSRGLAGVREGTVIVNLPGSSNGAREGMNALFPYLLHVYKMMKGGGH